MSDDKTSLKEVVSNYLRENPGFLEENPDVLESLQINHSSGTAVSLIERQVEQLRASNEDLNNRLNGLVRVAAENEQLISRLHRLTLELMPIESRSDFFTQLGRRDVRISVAGFRCEDQRPWPSAALIEEVPPSKNVKVLFHFLQ